MLKFIPMFLVEHQTSWSFLASIFILQKYRRGETNTLTLMIKGKGTPPLCERFNKAYTFADFIRGSLGHERSHETMHAVRVKVLQKQRLLHCSLGQSL